eukprot:Clim_evm47s201 gene=Clim_evmTU47s201
MGTFFAKFDSFSKAEHDNMVRTPAGGVTFFTALFTALILVLAELRDWGSLKMEYSYEIDNTRTAPGLDTVPIDIDIVVRGSCDYYQVDILDRTPDGQASMDQTSGIQSHLRFTKTYFELDKFEWMELRAARYPPEKAGVKIDRDRARTTRLIEIAKRERGDDRLKKVRDACRISGTLIGRKVASTLRIYYGEKYVDHFGDTHVRRISDPNFIYDTSHRFEVFEIGYQPDDGIATYANMHLPHKVNVVDLEERDYINLGFEKIVARDGKDARIEDVPKDAGTKAVDYYLQVIPTLYEDRFGRLTLLNQIAATRQETHAEATVAAALNNQGEVDLAKLLSQTDGGGSLKRTPGIFMHFNFYELTMKVKEYRTPVIVIFVRIAALIGGVFATASYLRALIEGPMAKQQVARTRGEPNYGRDLRVGPTPSPTRELIDQEDSLDSYSAPTQKEEARLLVPDSGGRS